MKQNPDATDSEIESFTKRLETQSKNPNFVFISEKEKREIRDRYTKDIEKKVEGSRKQINFLAAQIASEHPDWDRKQVINAARDAVRKKYGLKTDEDARQESVRKKYARRERERQFNNAKKQVKNVMEWGKDVVRQAFPMPQSD